MSEKQPLVPNQRWTPAPGKRARPRLITAVLTSTDEYGEGFPCVVYAMCLPHGARTGTSFMRAEGFKTWLRKMRATCEEARDE